MIINKKYLAANCPLPTNFDYTDIMPYVEISERLWVIPAIGRDFYDELDEQVRTDTLTEENAALLTEGGLWMYLSYATVLQALPFLWIHISSVGLTQGFSDNSKSAELKDLTLLQTSLRSTVEFLKEQVIKYLCERSDYFPLFDTKQCDCGCGCSCSTNAGKLKMPNKYQQLYTPKRRCTTFI